MKTAATLLNLATSLSQNASAANQSLLLQLLSDQHRYLIQKYFDNERLYQTTTVGGQSLTLTATVSAGAISATLTSAWVYPTVTQLVNFSDGEQRLVLFTYNSTAISWQGALNANVTTAISSVGAQNYSIPANISKVKNNTITVGQLQYVPTTIQTLAEWLLTNTLPYTSDIPNNFFLYNGSVRFWPIPSTTGNLISFYYKARVPEFTFLFQSGNAVWTPGNTPTDYTNGTISVSAGNTAVTGSSTSWNTTGTFPLNTDVTIFNLYLQVTPPKGDGIWYPISQFNSDTSLTLALPIQNAPVTSGATYSIGQMPLLQEDFHDMLPYGLLMTYFSSIVANEGKFKQFETLFTNRLALLEDYAGTKTASNVDLGGPLNYRNPNLYPYAQPGQ